MWMIVLQARPASSGAEIRAQLKGRKIARAREK
jgi:hypothetical protein